MDQELIFKDVTLLITHYNRSASLERLLTAFRDLKMTFGAVVVSDDCSKSEHLQRVRELQGVFDFRLITTEVNRGLGNNINKGQDVVDTPLTLYIQEDFIPLPAFRAHFPDAAEFMREQEDLDIIRCYAYFPYPKLRAYRKGFAEMIFSFWNLHHLKFYYYSDHPHLRRSNFLQKFGRYKEGVKGDETEFSMSLCFIRKKGKGLFYTGFRELFDQRNSEEEPSMIEREKWRQRRSAGVLILRWFYLIFKFIKSTIRLYFGK